MWGADEGSAALATSVKTRVEDCLLSYDSSWPVLHEAEQNHMANLPVCVAPGGISGLPQNSQDKTEQLMKSGLPQLRQKMQLYGMSAGLQCLKPDLRLFTDYKSKFILEVLCILHGIIESKIRDSNLLGQVL